MTRIPIDRIAMNRTTLRLFNKLISNYISFKSPTTRESIVSFFLFLYKEETHQLIVVLMIFHLQIESTLQKEFFNFEFKWRKITLMLT